MGDQWHYSRAGVQSGPVPAAELMRLAATGQLLPTDMVWAEGMAAWVSASSVKGLFNAVVSPPYVVPPSLPPVASESETITCAFCQKPMPLKAIQCSSCKNWRQDIHLLIQRYRRLATIQIICLVMGTVGTGLGLGVALKEVGSIEKVPQSRPFWFIVVYGLFTIGAYLWTQIPAAQIGNRSQDMTGGLWKRLK